MAGSLVVVVFGMELHILKYTGATMKRHPLRDVKKNEPTSFISYIGKVNEQKKNDYGQSFSKLIAPHL